MRRCARARAATGASSTPALKRRERLNARREEMRAQTARADSRRREKRMHIIVGVGVGVLIVAALLMIGMLPGVYYILTGRAL